MEEFKFKDENEEITSVTVAYADLPPFVHIKNDDGEEILDGFMPDIIRAVTQWMKLNVTWIREPEDKYGFWNGTTFSGMVGMLHRNEVDFIVNPIIPNEEILRIADFMNPIIYEAFTVLSGKEKQEGGLFLYFSVLQPTVWAYLGISLIVIAVVTAILFLRVSDGFISGLLAFAEYIWVYVAYMLQQVANEKWIMRQNRSWLSFFIPFLLLSWMIGVAFLIMTVFESLLVSKLAIVRQYPIVDSLDEFVRKPQVIGWTPREIELQIVLKDSGIEVYDKTWERLEPELVDSETLFSDDAFKKVQEGKVCLIHGHLIFRSVLSEYFTRKGKCNFHLSENTFYPFPLLVALKKTLPKKFKDKFNMGVTRLVEADISGKWFKSVFRICHLCTSYSETDLKPLSLNNIYGVLVIWGIGMTSAGVSVIAENVYFKYQQKKVHKKRNHIYD